MTSLSTFTIVAAEHSASPDVAGTILAVVIVGGQGLAGVLRPGRAGSNNAADHLAVLDAALAQLPVTPADTTEMLVRTDTAGATHGFIDGCVDRDVRFSVGLPIDAAVPNAFMLVQEADWTPAVETDGSVATALGSSSSPTYSITAGVSR